MRVFISSPVWEDLRHIIDTIAPDNPLAAERVVDAAQQAFELIGKHPGIGRPRSFAQPGIRSWPIREFPDYLIFYLPRRELVHIIAVVHGAREFQQIIEARA